MEQEEEEAPLHLTVPAMLVGTEKGSDGTLLLTQTELQWRAAGASVPEPCATLAGVRHVAVAWKQLTPFHGVSELQLHGARLA